MTETTKRIFDVYQVRKTKQQKRAFAEYVRQIAEQNAYTFSVETGCLGARNLVIGDVENADVVYTAHYDTCVGLPFPNFITPTNFVVYLLYQMVLVVCLLVPILLAELLLGGVAGVMAALSGNDALLPVFMLIGTYAVLFGFLFLFFAGPANKHTANDNTSGVTTVLDILQALSPAHKTRVAFVLFDLEEAGLFGSMAFAAKHKNAMKTKLLINFDCVSDGDTMLFAVKKNAKRYVPLLEEAFAPTETKAVKILTKGVFYPSDQANFPCGVGVAALKRSKMLGLLYMNRIHTKRDVIYEEENIEFFKNGALRLIERL